jgi:MFS family permease
MTRAPFPLYLIGTGSWFLAFGIQSVMFAWLVTMVLREAPQLVGIAQMTMLIPTMLFILVGGSLADVVGPRRVILTAQSAAMLPPLFLLIVVAIGELSLSAMLAYAVVIGLAQAFVTPARDGLLNLVAQSGVQRAVVATSMTQFGVQLAGFGIASLAEAIGAVPILALQTIILGVGVGAFARIPMPELPGRLRSHRLRDMRRSIAEGFRTVAASPPMRMTVVVSIAMGTCFMGSYIVTLPLLVREFYAGAATDLAMMNAANSLGLVTTILVLLRLGDVQRPGRALLGAQMIGSVALGSIGFGFGFPILLALVFVWGMGGGVAMSMSRTIMQSLAPPHQRSRVMSCYSLAFMGSGPFGALLNGYLVDWVGARAALAIAASAMLTTMLVVAIASRLWRLGNLTA